MRKRKTTHEKPYNRCLNCHYRGVKCDGPRTSAMTLERWCEFMSDMKEANGLTNAEIAEKAKVSEKRVEELMAMKCDHDIRRETARLIEDAIIGSSNNYPCILAYEDEHPQDDQRLTEALREFEKALENNRDYKGILDNIHIAHHTEMQAIREEHREHIERLRDHIDRLVAENALKSDIINKFVLNK